MISRVVLSEQVKAELLDDIMSGRYKPGDRRVGPQIAKRMGISKSAHGQSIWRARSRWNAASISLTNLKMRLIAWRKPSKQVMIEARTFVSLSNLMARNPERDMAGMRNLIIKALRKRDAQRCGTEKRNHVEEFGKVMHGILHDDAGQQQLEPNVQSFDFGMVGST